MSEEKNDAGNAPEATPEADPKAAALERVYNFLEEMRFACRVADVVHPDGILALRVVVARLGYEDHRIATVPEVPALLTDLELLLGSPPDLDGGW
jgi:hypothetical protein